MKRTNRLLTALTGVGFVVSVGAWVFAALGGSRSAAISVFAAGFIAAAVGMCIRMLLMPGTDDQGRSVFGSKVAAFGFAVAAIPMALGTLLLGIPEEELVPVFYTGGVIILVGIAMNWISLTRGKR